MQRTAFAAPSTGPYPQAVKECGDLVYRDAVKIDIVTVSEKRAQYLRRTVEPHASVSFVLDIEVNGLGELHASPPRSTAATARSAGRSTFA
jgi:hypothetical protein